MGIRIDSLKQYAKSACRKIGILRTTTPETLKGAGLVAPKLEPLATDTTSFTRIEDLGSKELRKLLEKTIRPYTDMVGGSAVCFNLDRYPELLLRVNARTELRFSEYNKLVPVSYPSSAITQNPNLGLPLFAVVDDADKTIPNVIPADKVFSPMRTMWILKKMRGADPASGYRSELLKFLGAGSEGCYCYNVTQLEHYMCNSADIGKAIGFLDACKTGACIRGELFNGKVKLQLSDTRTFYDNYRGFVESYLDTIDRISRLPSRTFDKAASDIKTHTREHGIRFDFQHVGNTLIDGNEAFNFVDLNLSECSEHFNAGRISSDIDDFKDVLLGRGCTRRVTQPRSYILCPEDKKRFEEINGRLATRIYQAWM